jgi:hypothetical protein
MLPCKLGLHKGQLGLNLSGLEAWFHFNVKNIFLDSPRVGPPNFATHPFHNLNLSWEVHRLLKHLQLFAGCPGTSFWECRPALSNVFSNPECSGCLGVTHLMILHDRSCHHVNLTFAYVEAMDRVVKYSTHNQESDVEDVSTSASESEACSVLV